MINRKLQTRDPKKLENVSNSSMKTVTFTFLREEGLPVKKSTQCFELMAQTMWASCYHKNSALILQFYKKFFPVLTLKHMTKAFVKSHYSFSTFLFLVKNLIQFHRGFDFIVLHKKDVKTGSSCIKWPINTFLHTGFFSVEQMSWYQF